MVTSSTKRALPSATRAVSPPAKRKVQSATTKSAVASFFTPASQKEPERMTWAVREKTLLVGTYTPKEKGEEVKRSKIAGFDLDGTLIRTQSGAKFAKNDLDWKWWADCVPGKLRKLHDSGYHVVVFTNQGGLQVPAKNTKGYQMFKSKVTGILGALDLPISVYAATGKDKFRKPRSGMWEEMLKDLGGEVELEGSYLVGDAAGRVGDFSDSDWHWAANNGIAFHTPEEFFLGEKARPMEHRFDPGSYLKEDVGKVASVFTPSETQQLIVFVGSPGAGKSTFYWRVLEPLGVERVNQDTLKTKQKCIKTADALLKEGKSVAIDNTNANVETRENYIALARKHSVPVRCVYFTSPAPLCIHNDAVRAFNESLNPEQRTLLPGLAFTQYKSRFQEPKLEEGFSELIKLDFTWQGGEEDRQVWGKFWT